MDPDMAIDSTSHRRPNPYGIHLSIHTTGYSQIIVLKEN